MKGNFAREVPSRMAAVAVGILVSLLNAFGKVSVSDRVGRWIWNFLHYCPNTRKNTPSTSRVTLAFVPLVEAPAFCQTTPFVSAAAFCT